MSEQAKRLYTPEGRLHPDIEDDVICYWRDHVGMWWVYLPRGGAGYLENHTVTEHEDQTISVMPSIKLGKRHGFLERGIWREA